MYPKLTIYHYFYLGPLPKSEYPESMCYMPPKGTEVISLLTQFRIFSDDVANCANTALNLQLQLNHITEICYRAGININKSKTDIQSFEIGDPLRYYE